MSYLYIHLVLMISVFFISLFAAIIAKFFRKKIWWLKKHKLFNQIKTILAITGFIIAIIMVNNFQIGHFSTFHGIIGLITVCLILIQSTAGFLITINILSRIKLFKNLNTKKLDEIRLNDFNANKILRLIHKKSGLIIILLILLNIIIGLTKIF
ncbi:MAG: hypothetical protein ACK4YF_05870 [Exilispira sp.]